MRQNGNMYLILHFQAATLKRVKVKKIGEIHFNHVYILNTLKYTALVSSWTVQDI